MCPYVALRSGPACGARNAHVSVLHALVCLSLIRIVNDFEGPSCELTRMNSGNPSWREHPRHDYMLKCGFALAGMRAFHGGELKQVNSSNPS